MARGICLFGGPLQMSTHWEKLSIRRSLALSAPFCQAKPGSGKKASSALGLCPSFQEERESLRASRARACSLPPPLEPEYDPRKTQTPVAKGNEQEKRVGDRGKGKQGRRGKTGGGSGAEVVTWVR